MTNLSRTGGYSVVEMLVASVISALLLLSIGHWLPSLIHALYRDGHRASAREALWQLSDSIGKQLRRAGYCHQHCYRQSAPVLLTPNCVLFQWQTPDNEEPVWTGYRLFAGRLQIRNNVSHCDGAGWESLSDPALMQITHFSVTPHTRHLQKTLLVIRLEAKIFPSGEPIYLRHSVTGENL